LLAKPHRITRAGEFRATMKAGRRCGGELLITHALVTESGVPARFGFVVSKALGNAVRRNAVKRRLRALTAERVAAGVAGVDVVVRALPAAATASFDALRAELSGQLGRIA
jgi:ribonuclease P protein component